MGSPGGDLPRAEERRDDQRRDPGLALGRPPPLGILPGPEELDRPVDHRADRRARLCLSPGVSGTRARKASDARPQKPWPTNRRRDIVTTFIRLPLSR